ncbi:hypothetical protein GUITHDRAFT_119690 [Guillardia theta CCMP2712]|uniref:Uncharacterized protein n=1 Tax=Guillardia theta (strain CCMP2712) TaxID=905079 RepID=L1IE80_GUITC|nr:hypothetical protein GUITHDRAFT_119690 [Guillardia theta CCMP2712]EKX34135.1 hypothetical protein GUITHDRAFT_119690 [Guillardia theta CCMP2712]|eukprot:XP_005821115.1 hypothetical protein GUITHDRAFT_119690 [Guillardia theta CCMP2712]
MMKVFATCCTVLEADLVERVKSFAKRFPNSRTAQACKAVEGCTPDAIAEAIRSTCQQARRELLQEALTGWSDASREWFMQQMEEAKKEKVETYTATAGNEMTSFISMTLLGLSSVYVNHEDSEKMKKKFEEIGLIVDSVQESKSIMWKAPYRPEIASADEIPVTVSFLCNALAEKLWQGREDFQIDATASGSMSKLTASSLIAAPSKDKGSSFIMRRASSVESRKMHSLDPFHDLVFESSSMSMPSTLMSSLFAISNKTLSALAMDVLPPLHSPSISFLVKRPVAAVDLMMILISLSSLRPAFFFCVLAAFFNLFLDTKLSAVSSTASRRLPDLRVLAE